MTTRWQIWLVLISALCAFTATATAEPYWITYEGNDLPENEGWGRSWGNDDGQYHGDGAIRTVENGILTMDSLYDLRVYDYAYVGLPGQLDPDPSEMFIVEWRLKVDEVIGGYYDPSIGIKSDTRMTVGLGYHVDRIESVFEDGVFIPITPGVFHEYRMLSSDMQTYELYVDGELAHLGTFWQGAGESRVGWGAPVSGASSRSHWDFVRFGVVPEPVSFVIMFGLYACAIRGRRSCVAST